MSSVQIPPLRADADAVAWRPTREYVERSRLRRLMSDLGIESFDGLLTWAAAHPAEFWDATLRELGLEFYRPYTATLDMGRGLPWTRWFVGGLYNYAHDAVDKWAAGPKAASPALLWEGEEGATRSLSYGELAEEANRLAGALRDRGIGRGDRVGIFLPMIPETVMAMLALAKLGAIAIPIFSGYAAPSAATRLVDCEAVALITADGFYRRGKAVEMKRIADEAVAAAPAVKTVVVVRRTGDAAPWTTGRDVWWHDLREVGPTTFETCRTEPEDPYMIIYTSGTTGRPKGAVHVHGGFPIKGAQDLAHCFDVQQDDVLFWLTDLGWMMGPWAISGTLMLGATLLLYDGTPDYPGPDRLWALAERHGVTVMGIAPTAVRALRTHGDAPVRAHPLSALRVLGSTGEPWDPDSWRWLFETVGRGRCPIINYSGGTEISGGIVGCTTITPLKPCCFAGPVPGMDADVVDEDGHPVRGRVGELVLRGPWPGMTRGFWKDPDRYIDTYWSRFPDTWVHGDWAEIDADGFWYIRGRSDDTIKVAGKRLGPAEVESAALTHPGVAAAAAIGVPDELKGESAVVFAVLRPGERESEALRGEIEAAIVAVLGKALKPRAVRFVSDLPRTRNAKILRRVIRAGYLGQPLGDVSSLENPAAVEELGRTR
jgi:acetyl-CoA synthetase